MGEKGMRLDFYFGIGFSVSVSLSLSVSFCFFFCLCLSLSVDVQSITEVIGKVGNGGISEPIPNLFVPFSLFPFPSYPSYPRHAMQEKSRGYAERKTTLRYAERKTTLCKLWNPM